MVFESLLVDILNRYLKPYVKKIDSSNLNQSRHWDSGKTLSVTTCSLSCKILAKTFPTTSSRLIPLQLLHFLRSPFLGMGTISASCQSLTTYPLFHTSSINKSSLSCSSAPPCSRINRKY